MLIAVASVLAPWWWVGELGVHCSGLAAIALLPALMVCWRRPAWMAVLLATMGIGCWPWWRSAREPRAAVVHQASFSVATANLYDFNQQRDTALASIGAMPVDVLAVQETHPSDRHSLLQRWSYAVLTEDRRLLASALFSRHPIVWSFVHDLDGYALVDALVQTPTGLVRIYVAHLQSPTSPARLANRTRQLHQLALLIRESAEPVLLLGDLNLGSVSPRWSTFTREADLRRPDGRTPATWPAWLGPAGTDIDHVAGRGVAFGPLEAFTIPGSDHRGLRTVCALERRP
jgi:vancomycin resistance protein VanJ